MMNYHILTAPGSRTENQDAAVALRWRDGGLYALADGLGGHGHGAEAAQLAMRQLKALIPPDQAEDLPNLLQQSLQQVHSQLRGGAPTAGRTTVALCALLGSQLYVAHVGDSRAYLFNRRRMLWRTLDHSVPQVLAQAGQIREKDIRHHPDRNRLLRALGNGDEPVAVDMHACAAEEVHAILLCTDGFWDWVTERQMASALRHAATPALWLQRMEQTLLRHSRGQELDNYTAIGVYL